MNIKRSLYCLFVLLCCLPVFSVVAQDVTLPAPVGTLVEPVVTVVEPILTTSDSTSVPGGSDATSVPGDSDATTEPDITGVIGPDKPAADGMSTMEPGVMGTMEAGMMLPDDPNARTIGDIIVFQADLNVPEFTMLRAALETTGLLETLMDENVDYVLFAPTDAAFAKLPQATVDMLMNDSQVLRLALLNHVVPGRLLTDDIDMMATMQPGMMATEDMMMATMEPDMMTDHCMMDDDMMATMEPGMMATEDMMMATMEPNMMGQTLELPSLGGLPLIVKIYADCATVNDIPVGTEITASNGRIYIIDSVIMPEMSDMMMTMEPGMMATDDMMMATMEADMMATMEATEAP